MSTDALESLFVPQAVPVLHSSRVQELEASASARGYAAGYAAGARAAQEGVEHLRTSLEGEYDRRAVEQADRAESVLAVLLEAARVLAERTVPVVETAQHAVVRGALDLAESIVGLELGDRAHAAQAALSRVTAEVDAAVVGVRMHPDDIALLAREGFDVPVLVADPSMLRGDAVADLEHGFLDARIGTAIARARAELADLADLAGPGPGSAGAIA